jgi:hypothetical protein
MLRFIFAAAVVVAAIETMAPVFPRSTQTAPDKCHQVKSSCINDDNDLDDTIMGQGFQDSGALHQKVAHPAIMSLQTDYCRCLDENSTADGYDPPHYRKCREVRHLT